MSKIDRLYAREILSLTIVILAVVSSVMFVFRLFAFADLIVLSQDALSTIVLFIVFLFPMILKLTVPMSLLIASLIVTLRMSHDREVEALMAAGASVWRIALAPTLIGVGATTLALYAGLYLEPYAREQMSRFRWIQTVNGLENFIGSRLEDKTFLTDIFPLEDLDVSLYVNEMTEPHGSFDGVLLSIRNPNSSSHDEVLLVADSGSIRKIDDGAGPDYVFAAENGRIYRPAEDKSPPRDQEERGEDSLDTEDSRAEDLERPESDDVDEKLGVDAAVDDGSEVAVASGSEGRPPVNFDRSRFMGPLGEPVNRLAIRAGNWDVFEFESLKLSIFSLFRQRLNTSGDDSTDIRTLEPVEYVRELRRRRASEDWGTSQRYVRDHTYFYEAAAVPFACLFLPLIGICLGISDPRRRPGYAYLGLGVAIFLYYAAVMVCQHLALLFWVDPEVTLWLPFLVLVSVAATLVRLRTVYPPSTSFFEMLREDKAKLNRKVAALRSRG